MPHVSKRLFTDSDYNLLWSRCKYQHRRKGVPMEKEWFDSLEAFHSGIGEHPDLNHIFGMKDPTLGYVPKNARWFVRDNIAFLTSSFEIEGVTKSIYEWCIVYSVLPVRVWDRYRLGCKDILKCITFPLYKRSKVRKDKLSKEEHLRRDRERYATDPIYNLEIRCRKRFQHALKAAKLGKTEKTQEMIGTSWDRLQLYLITTMTPGMTWDLVQKGAIEIDHIKPIKRFNLSDPEEQKRCFHFTNLQLLWKADNIRKRHHYNGDGLHIDVAAILGNDGKIVQNLTKAA